MKIKAREFCNLANSSSFLTWLGKIDRNIFNDLVNHLKQSLGCNANHNKMLEIMPILSNKYIAELEAFLRLEHPHLIEVDDVVFPDYTPGVLTFPQRQILTRQDALVTNQSMLEVAEAFCKKHPICKYRIQDDNIYLEYLSTKYAHLRDSIPGKNWLLK